MESWYDDLLEWVKAHPETDDVLKDIDASITFNGKYYQIEETEKISHILDLIEVSNDICREEILTACIVTGLKLMSAVELFLNECEQSIFS